MTDDFTNPFQGEQPESLHFDVTIEIPRGNKNKYEMDHETGSHPSRPHLVHLYAVPV